MSGEFEQRAQSAQVLSVMLPESSPPPRGKLPAGSWDPRLYDSSHSFVWQAGASLVELLAPQPGETIVDLGCGTGHLTAQIQTAGARVIGLDSSPEMIAQARQLYPQLDFRLADARHFQLQAPADALFSNAVLHWVQPPELAVAAMALALRSGGRLVAEFGGRGNVARIVEALSAQAELFGIAPVEFPWYYPSVAEYATLLEQHDLEVTWAQLFDRPTPLQGDDGLRQWLVMFATAWTSRLDADRRETFLNAVCQQLRPHLCRDGQWQADYRRLRIVARKR